MYRVLDVANYAIQYYLQNNWDITLSRLQSILYVAQAEFLVVTGNTLFSENIIAKANGTCIEEVQYAFRRYDGVPLDSKALNWDCYDYMLASHRELLKDVLTQCCAYSDSELSDRIMSQSPWRVAYNYDVSLEKPYHRIEPEVLRSYYSKVADDEPDMTYRPIRRMKNIRCMRKWK